jgi:hypothetical protein
MGEPGEAGDREWLSGLAEFLITRHINVSVPSCELRRDLLAEQDSALWEQSQRKFRCVAVVGAGASAPVLDRGDDLASGLIRKFNIEQAAVEAEKERLGRITAVDPTEFEAQLSAIGQTLGNSRRVQAAISELYRVRHPTILAYELLAHLIKHRFIDAIISMNFDELLDQSLADEVGADEYERIVSDRDCVDVQSNVFTPDYIPLYIKLHGTASEPESIRFTRESYYDSPAQVGTEAARLFQTPECIVLNLGFGMTSFDLHRLLAIPDAVRLYNLSHQQLTVQARQALQRERQHHKKDESSLEFFESPENREKLEEEERAIEQGRASIPPPSPREGKSEASDLMMDALLRGIDRRVRDLQGKESYAVSLRSVDRHRTVVGLLGPNSKPGKRLVGLPRSSDPHLSLDPVIRAARPNAVTAGYLLRRTILELALAMARARGLVSVATLAVDRCGSYYDAYRRCAGKNPKSWRDLYTLVGFEQNRKVPDVFEATEAIQEADLYEKGVYERFLKDPFGKKEDEWRELPRLDIQKLVERVIPHIVDSPSEEDISLLTAELEELRDGFEYEIHSRDDRVCSKTFSRPITLKTLSSFEAHSFDLVKLAGEGGSATEVDVISETGDWLLKHGNVFSSYLENVGRIRLIVAFLSDVETLFDEFDGIKLKYQQPWHHNRHMVIVRKNSEPLRAIYFARHHRTPYVTPVLVRRRGDIEVLQSTFGTRWKNSRRLKERPGPPGQG